MKATKDKHFTICTWTMKEDSVHQNDPLDAHNFDIYFYGSETEPNTYYEVDFIGANGRETLNLSKETLWEANKFKKYIRNKMHERYGKSVGATIFY